MWTIFTHFLSQMTRYRLGFPIDRHGNCILLADILELDTVIEVLLRFAIRFDESTLI